MYISILFPLFFLSILLNVCVGVHYQGPGPVIEDQPLQQQCCASKSPLVGTLTPIYLPLDRYSKLNFDLIPTYLNFLSNNGIHGIILFSVETATFELTQEERKLLLSATAKETKRLGLTLVVQVGGLDINDTIDLVKQSKKEGVDGILCRSEFYYAAPTVAGVVEYLQFVAKAAYPTPFLYSDLEFECDLDYSTIGIVKALKAKVRNFAGFKTTLTRALIVVAALGNSDISVFSSDSADIVAPYAFCLNGSSAIIANIFPKYVVAAQQATLKGDTEFADAIAKKINRVYYGCIATAKNERVDRTLLGYKIQIGSLLMWIVNGIDVGNAASPPLPILTSAQEMKCYRICQSEGVAKRNPSDKPGYPKNYDIYGIQNKDDDGDYPDYDNNNTSSNYDHPDNDKEYSNSGYDSSDSVGESQNNGSDQD